MHHTKLVAVFLAAFLWCSGAVCASAERLDDILKSGQINIGVAFFLPWTIQTKNGGLIGYEIDLSKKVAQELGVMPNFVVYTWEDLLPALENGDIDMIAAGLYITPQRALKFTFSMPTSEDGTTLATNTALTKDFAGFNDFDRPSITIAAVAGTAYADVAKAKFNRANIQEYLTTEDAEKALLRGDVHAYAASIVKTRFLALESPRTIDVPLPKPLQRAKAAFAVPMGEQNFVNFLNAIIISHEADEWLAEKRRFWFKSLDWSSQLN